MHFCLGTPLARLEARVALETLLSQCASLSLRPEPLAWNYSLTVRGVRSLPLTLKSEGMLAPEQPPPPRQKA
jgi:cytochrome P450